MNKKKWALLLLAAILIFGYIKLFYKTYNEKTVPQTADYIVAVDVKRITNTLIWQFLTTPGQWKNISFSSKKSKELSWKDMVELPDYVLAFHAANQPASIWYLLLSIKDKADFEKGLVQFQFEKINTNEYLNKTAGLYLFVHDNKVLVANTLASNKDYVLAVADELFTKKTFISKDKLAKAIDAKSHLAVYIPANNFLQKEAVIKANFDKQKVEITGDLTPASKYIFTEKKFSYFSGSLCTAGFTQPQAAVYNLLSTADKGKISTALNFNIDSVMQTGNNWYSLNLAQIKTRADSAVTYTYDDEFNQVEKVTVNNIQEPAFSFIVTGNNPSQFYNYLQNNSKLEATAAGSLFLPMPLVKSYCNIASDTQLVISSAGYSNVNTDRSIQAVFFINLFISRIPENLKNYFPDAVKNSLSNLETIHISSVKKDAQLLLKAVIEKKKNDSPIIHF